MPISHKDYRTHLYENRTHPELITHSQINEVGSKLWIYSSFPFLILEYIFEVEMKKFPSGLLFPAGYVIFWSFYQTILFTSKKKEAVSVKIPKAKPKFQPRKELPPRPHAHRASDIPPPLPEKDFLPEKVLENLSVLGLKPTRDWAVIHKRYRELAKQYHPDLNPEVTTRGTRFMIYDSAYRNLLKVKTEYFTEMTKTG